MAHSCCQKLYPSAAITRFNYKKKVRIKKLKQLEGKKILVKTVKHLNIHFLNLKTIHTFLTFDSMDFIFSASWWEFDLVLKGDVLGDTDLSFLTEVLSNFFLALFWFNLAESDLAAAFVRAVSCEHFGNTVTKILLTVLKLNEKNCKN